MMLDFATLIDHLAVEMNDNLLSIANDNGNISRNQVLALIERESQSLLTWAKAHNLDAFRYSTDISYVADQRTYALPYAAAQITEVRPLDADGNERNWRIYPIDFRDRNRSTVVPYTTSENTSSAGYWPEFALPSTGASRLLMVGIRPTPADAETNATRVFWIPRRIRLHYGTAGAGATTTLTMDTTPTAGSLILVADYYAGASLYISGGTGAGQTRQIESNTAAGVATVNDWTTNPDNTSTYSILPFLPDQAQDALVLGVALRTAVGDDDRTRGSMQDLKERYGQAKMDLIYEMTQLQRDEPMGVRQLFDQSLEGSRGP